MGLFDSNTDRSVWELQVILKGLGAPLVIDKTFGPITQRTWSLLSSNLGLDPRFERVSALVASVNKNTYAKLLNEYILRKAPKPGGSTDFERLNNAILLLSKTVQNPEVENLDRDWMNIANSPVWRSAVMALPPVWAQSLNLHWNRYLDVWGKLTTQEKTKLVHPAAIEPGGVVQAFKDLWSPTLEAARAKGIQILQATGRQLAKGAAEETREQTYEWAWSLGGVALGAFGLWWYFRDRDKQ